MSGHKATDQSLCGALTLALCVVTAAGVAGQENPVARVTFVDGASIEVSNLALSYSWVYKSDNDRWSNPPVHTIPADTLYFTETIRATSLERVMRVADIAKITIRYSNDSLCSDGFDVTSLAGTTSSVTFFGMGIPPDPDDSTTNPRVFYRLHLTGIAVVEGQKGQFEGKLFGSGACPSREEAMAEIIFP